MKQKQSSKLIVIAALFGALVLSLGAEASNNGALSSSGEVSNSQYVLTSDEQLTVFQMVGAKQREGKWVIDRETSGTLGQASIEFVRDLNGDGRPEVMVIDADDDASYYGVTGQQFTLLSKQDDESWIVMAQEIAVPKILNSRGVDGWPDIELGGPGFSFPVIRWNGKNYVQHGTIQE